MVERASPGGFVGRTTELGILRGLVASVAKGHGGAVWVEGEPGIGKSALVSEALSGAEELGCAVFTGVADELRGRFPLGVMLDGLDAGGGLGAGERREIAGLLRGEGLRGILPAGDAVAVAAERVLALVDRLCAVSPVVLVIDDLQWADEASVSVWHRLAAGVNQVPLLVVGAARQVPRSPGLVVARQGVMRRGGVVLTLRPLPSAEVTALVEGLVGGPPGPRLAAQVAQTGGNPLYLRELADALLREDRVRLREGVAEITGEPGQVAVSLAEAIQDRLGFVSPETLEVLRAAALLGVRFSVRDLTVVTRRGARELAGAVTEAAQAGVLVESGLDLLFRHGLIQQALAEGIPAGVRAELHSAAARALAQAGAPAERVAAQLLAGGEVDGWMVGWLVEHAAVLVHRAPRAAAELLERAVAGVAVGDERGEVLAEHLAWVLFLLARYEQAEPVARELLARSRDPERRGRVAWALTSTLSRTGRSSEALAVADQALRDPVAAGEWPTRLRSMRAVALVNAVRFDEADSAAADALAEAERVGDRFAAGYCLHVRSVVCFSGGDLAGGLEFAERALAVIGDDPETADLRVLLSVNRLSALANLDRDTGAGVHELLTVAERNGTARAATARGVVAEVLFEAGRWDDALAELDVLLQPGGDIEAPIELSLRGLAALIAAHRDDQASVTAHLRAADHLPDPPGGWRLYGLHVLRVKAMAAERDGRSGEAAALLGAGLSGGYFADQEELEGLADLVRCALAAGDRPAAEAAAARCEQLASQLSDVGVTVAAARRCRGLVDGDLGLLGEAVAYYRTVTRPLELGQALEDVAVVRAA
ncbi:MAG TPA: AAA family ATPase, partial [Streptosporangiaceae bacterium]|nr:AAA family ATPase [Streptosporangiaceae bacterium]